ncbi:unnamed protein product, partial [Darwinula stevensoni]
RSVCPPAGPSVRSTSRGQAVNQTSAIASASSPRTSQVEAEPTIKEEVVDLEEDSAQGGDFEQSAEQEEWDEEAQASYYSEGEGATRSSQDLPQNIPPEIDPS